MASTYVNDLRLEEIATGEQSGTWGDTTNTNLELIAEAFSFGTEAITTNADTHTTTIADGATDPGRSMFLKYTGTLDSACTITIAPNTVSKLWFIENGTSGSQNIIISQGSGANITIPPGDTKAIYSDGAGSGAAMVDAFASLSVVDLKVQDDLTVTDDMTVGGTLGVTGIATFTDDIIIGDGKTIGSASDVDAMSISSGGVVNFSARPTFAASLTIQDGGSLGSASDLNAMTISSGGVVAVTATTASTSSTTGALTVGGGLGVAADLFVGDDFDVTGDAVIDGTALVTGVLTTTAQTVFNGGFTANDGSIITTADNTTQLSLISTDTDANTGPVFVLWRNSANSADGDNTGKIAFQGEDDAGNKTTYSTIDTFISDNTNGTEDGQLALKTVVAGTERHRINMKSAETVINDDSVDLDFRVESNGNANMLFVDGGNNAVMVGHSVDLAIVNASMELGVVGTSCTLGVARFGGAPTIALAASASGTIGSFSVLSDDDSMGFIYFGGDDGTDIRTAGASIAAFVDGTPGSNDMPGRLVFSTTADGAASSTQRAMIDALGVLSVKNTGSTANFVGQTDSSFVLGSGSGNHAMTIFTGTSNNGSIYFADGNAADSTTYRGAVQYLHASDALRFFTAGSTNTAVTFDSTGRVLIGTTTEGQTQADNLTVSDSGNMGMTLRSTDSGECSIFFSDGTSGTPEYAGSIQYLHSANQMNFSTNATLGTRMLSNGAHQTSVNGTAFDTWSDNSDACQIVTNITDKMSFTVNAANGSFAKDVQRLLSDRSSGTAFDFLTCTSGNLGDDEFILRGDGNAYADASWNGGGADYAEYFESSTGSSIPRGTCVVMEDNKVRAATSSDSASSVVGVVRPKGFGKVSAMIGNVAWGRWDQKYLTDDFGVYVMEDHNMLEWEEEVEYMGEITKRPVNYESHNVPDGVVVPSDAVIKTHDEPGNKFQHRKLNPDYDPSRQYVSREDRDEWVVIGLLGQVPVLKGQHMGDRWVKMRNISETVEEWFIK